MFKRFGGSSSALWKSKKPHSVEYLRYLYEVLVKNEKVSDSNKTLLIEAIRTIAEILIWGDQNDSSIFDFFLERQMLSFFLSIMKQKCGYYVDVQLLQTLNILFENTKNETSLYYLLSNNHVNSIILHKFNFNNEEVIAYYISFLKTLSFRLNPYTIHFFFNEMTDEFPLFTEAINFIDHNESMVRVAVRTLTLNVFKISDKSTIKFVLKKSENFFNFLSKYIAQQIIEMDIFARSAQNEKSNRDRLMSMIDVHLDNMHYINDILMIENHDLNTLLMNELFNFIFGSLYLSSLADLRCGSTVLLSKVSSLFLLSQFVMIVHEKQAIKLVLNHLLFGDQHDICSEWVCSVEKGPYLIVRKPVVNSQKRFFFYSHLNALNEIQEDHACFYALMLIYCILQNNVNFYFVKASNKFLRSESVTMEALDAAHISTQQNSNKCDANLMQNLIKIIENCPSSDTSLRPITIELCCIVLRRLLLALKTDDELFHVAVEKAVSRAIELLIDDLRPAVFSENLFLEMFESEFYYLQLSELKMSMISEDPGLYLPPSNTALSGIPLSQRLPSGNDERIRRTLQFFFILRKLQLDLSGETETQLPLTSKLQPMAEINDCINLNNSDLLSCIVIKNKGEKQSMFLVTDQFQLILVEPDNRKLGWAIVRFVGLLQDTQIKGDSMDSRALHVIVENLRECSNVSKRLRSDDAFTNFKKPLLSAKFIFDDHIRCMAAKQRLNKGCKNSRQFKINLICHLFGIPSNLSSVSANLPRKNSKASVKQLSPSDLSYLRIGTPGRFESAADFFSSNNPLSMPAKFCGPGFVQKLSRSGEGRKYNKGENQKEYKNNDYCNNLVNGVKDTDNILFSQVPDDPDVKN